MKHDENIKLRIPDDIKKQFQEKCDGELMSISQRVRFLILKDLREEEKIPLYQKTKIGPNFHNSTGPINYRLYTLPANGVMQLCDNKSHLGSIFELDKEVVGFNTVEEAIELTKYYLSHENERVDIAVAGWKRALKDYNEYAVFGLVEKFVSELHPQLKPKFQSKVAIQFLIEHRKKTFIERTSFALRNKIKKIDIPENE